MTTYYVNSNNCAPWTPGTVYSVGDRCVALFTNTARVRFRVYECTTGGTSHATTQPSWNLTVGGTTNDNGVVWTTRNPDSWENANISVLSLFVDINTYLYEGDIILVHNAHAEDIGDTDSASAFYSFGTYSNPVKIICVDKNDSDALSYGAIIISRKDRVIRGYTVFINTRLSTYNNLTWYSNYVIDGMVFIGTFDNLTLLELLGATSIIDNSNQDYSLILIKNGNMQYAYAANTIKNIHYFGWFGGSLIAPNGITNLIDLSTSTNYRGEHIVRDVNLNAMGAGYLVNVGNSKVNVIFERCKLPTNLAGFSNGIWPLAGGFLGKIKGHHCSYENDSWGFFEESVEGTVQAESTIIRTGGASDGVQGISWKMVSSNQIFEGFTCLTSPTINLWNTSTSPITLTVHGIIDSAVNLQDDEVYLEVEYPADTTSGLGTLKTTQKIYEGIADLPTSTETWAESMANPNRFKLAATFTPAQAGPIAARVCVGKPSTTIYVCPKAVIS